mmetsp:Transcript_5830/g.18720  ORF Transcript_5830/g.18720 Transcript_5830/m.18720 type:complete len:226 (-) Transcript_5830:313-990(-)
MAWRVRGGADGDPGAGGLRRPAAVQDLQGGLHLQAQHGALQRRRGPYPHGARAEDDRRRLHQALPEDVPRRGPQHLAKPGLRLPAEGRPAGGLQPLHDLCHGHPRRWLPAPGYANAPFRRRPERAGHGGPEHHREEQTPQDERLPVPDGCRISLGKLHRQDGHAALPPGSEADHKDARRQGVPLPLRDDGGGKVLQQDPRGLLRHARLPQQGVPPLGVPLEREAI